MNAKQKQYLAELGPENFPDEELSDRLLDTFDYHGLTCLGCNVKDRTYLVVDEHGDPSVLTSDDVDELYVEMDGEGWGDDFSWELELPDEYERPDSDLGSEW